MNNISNSLTLPTPFPDAQKWLFNVLRIAFLSESSKYGSNNFSKTFEERKQTLVIDLSDDLPRVVGDPDALGKVFFHLLSNAIKYTPDGGKISVTGEFEREDSYVDHPVGKVQIKITDTGIGIDPRYKELIFTKESIHNKGWTW